MEWSYSAAGLGMGLYAYGKAFIWDANYKVVRVVF
jgi:hypothetical protein